MSDMQPVSDVPEDAQFGSGQVPPPPPPPPPAPPAPPMPVPPPPYGQMPGAVPPMPQAPMAPPPAQWAGQGVPGQPQAWQYQPQTPAAPKVSIIERLNSGKFAEKSFWIVAMRLMAWILVAIAVLMGLMMMITLASMVDYFGGMVVVLGLVLMLTIWITGFVGATFIMVHVNMADDINKMANAAAAQGEET